MDESDKLRFFQALIATAETTGKKISEAAMQVYWNTLKRYPIDDVLDGMGRHLVDPDVGQFMPKPADIVRNIDGNFTTRSMLAWTKVQKAIVSVGGYQSIVFDDPIIHAVIRDMGGWVKLCSVETDELPFRANEFEKRYRGYVNQRDISYPKALAGRASTHNESNGYAADLPMLFGDPKAAMLTFERGGEAPNPVQQMVATALLKSATQN